MNYADRVKETTTNTTTTTVTLGGAVTGFQTFATGFAALTTLIPAHIEDTAGNWEVSVYTLSASTTLTRTSILASSNGGAAVTFAAGTKNISCDVPASAIVDLTNAITLTNKRITARVLALGSGATPAINTDLYDRVTITALATNITSMTSSLTGTPVNGDTLTIDITDNGSARTIAWGASFEDSTISLPTTTVAGAKLTVYLDWNSVTSKWRCVGKA